MVEIMDLVKDAQDRALKTLEQAQGSAVNAVQTGFDQVNGTIPDLTWLRLGDYLPQPKEVADNAYDFAQKLLKVNRSFTNDLIKAASPVIKAFYGTTTPKAVKAA